MLSDVSCVVNISPPMLHSTQVQTRYTYNLYPLCCLGEAVMCVRGCGAFYLFDYIDYVQE